MRSPPMVLLDKVTTNKSSNNLREEPSVAALSASFDQEVEEDLIQDLEAATYPQSPQAVVTSTTSAGTY